MKLRFLMPHHRKNSVRDKVIGKKWIFYLFRFREKHTPQTERGPSQRASAAVKCGVVSFYRLGNFIS